jgi:hypothetical protein
MSPVSRVCHFFPAPRRNMSRTADAERAKKWHVGYHPAGQAIKQINPGLRSECSTGWLMPEAGRGIQTWITALEITRIR